MPSHCLYQSVSYNLFSLLGMIQSNKFYFIAVSTYFDVTILTNGSQLLGKSLTLQCFPSSSTFFSNTWMSCNNQTISSESVIIFNSLQLSHQGFYTCSVKVDKLVKKRTIYIEVVTDPSKLRISLQ